MFSRKVEGTLKTPVGAAFSRDHLISRLEAAPTTAKLLIKILLLLSQFYSDFVVEHINPIIFKISFFDQGGCLLTRVSFNRLVQTE